jgi:hypothetical protein
MDVGCILDDPPRAAVARLARTNAMSADTATAMPIKAGALMHEEDAADERVTLQSS